MVAVSRQIDIGNRILASLSQAEFGCVSEHLESVHLETGEVVYVAGDKLRYAYFPVNGLLSLGLSTETGSTLELAMVGREGLVGVDVINKTGIIPYEVIVRIATDTLRIKTEVLQEEFAKGEGLQHVILGYLSRLLYEISQSALCHRFHTIDEALSRWLLVAHDRVNSETLKVTHEMISNALGVPRTSVTTAAGSLQRAGVIRYSRGKIVILDRTRLEAQSCECYRMLPNEVKHFPKL